MSKQTEPEQNNDNHKVEQEMADIHAPHKPQANSAKGTSKPKWIVVTLVTLLALGALFGAIAFTKKGVEAKKNQKREKKIEKTLPTVQFIPVQANSYASDVVGFGEVKNRYNLALVSEVGGRLGYFSPKLAVGQRVRKGQVLLKVAQNDYKKDIVSRESALASAELNLLEEQRKRKQAKLEWQESGLSGQPDSPLVFREPQIKAAKAAIADAKLALQQSKQDLANTQVVAPFDAVVTAVAIQPRGMVQAGQNLATLASTDRAEISLPLTAGQWAQLPSQSAMVANKMPVQISSSDGIQTEGTPLPKWQGYVVRVGQTVDAKTRQRPIIVAVNNPLDKAEPLFAGSFVKVSITGKVIPNLWKIPATAMSQSGDIWFLDDKDCLQKQRINPLFTRGENMFLMASTAKIRLVLTPLNSYVNGMCVQAKNIALDNSTNTVAPTKNGAIKNGAIKNGGAE